MDSSCAKLPCPREYTALTLKKKDFYCRDLVFNHLGTNLYLQSATKWGRLRVVPQRHNIARRDREKKLYFSLLKSVKHKKVQLILSPIVVRKHRLTQKCPVLKANSLLICMRNEQVFDHRYSHETSIYIAARFSSIVGYKVFR